jgi:TP901 family phage tail tape measure protein
MFLRAAKTDAEEAGIETEGMAQSVAKLRDDILKIANVDIMVDDNNFKSTYQILDEISKKWEDLADIDKANLLNLMGGKRNANVLSSIIENFDEARSAMETAANAEGSALAENEKFLDSIAGHINQLKVNYEDLSQTVIDSDLVKFGVDFLSGITGGLNDIIKNFGTLQTLIPIIAGSLSAFKDVGRDKTLSLTEYADCGVVVTRNELMAA